MKGRYPVACFVLECSGLTEFYRESMSSSSAAPDKSTSRTIKTFFPILSWLPKYESGWLRFDVIAALTLWAVLVPEAMAYAGIAGMPA